MPQLPEVIHLEPLYVRVTFWNRGAGAPQQASIEGWMRECKEGIGVDGKRFTLESPAIEIHPGFNYDPNGWMWGIMLFDVIAIVPATIPPTTMQIRRIESDTSEGEGDPCPPQAENS